MSTIKENYEREVEVLPVHILKLRWLDSRRLFLLFSYEEVLNDLISEMTYPKTSQDNIHSLDALYDVVRAQNKRLGI